MTDPPSAWLALVLSGHIDLTDAPLSIQSWARLPIYKQACDIARLSTKEQRQAALAKVPDKLRPVIQAEVNRVWEWRED